MIMTTLPNGAITTPAYAKINRSLEVIRRRDDGYHDIATILQTISLADAVTLAPADGLMVQCDAPGLSGGNNLAWRAAIALADYAGVTPGARISIVKRIPIAAGLGGGSADAAAVLNGLNCLWQLHLPLSELAAIAASIGMDVPFLITGGAALATGSGDKLRPLPPLPTRQLTLVAPPSTIPNKTPALYGALIPADFSDGRHTRALADTIVDAALADADFAGGGRNAFTRAAREIFPGLASVMDTAASAAQIPPRLSGAGPAFFMLPSSQARHNAVADALRNSGAKAYLVHTVNPPGADFLSDAARPAGTLSPLSSPQPSPSPQPRP